MCIVLILDIKTRVLITESSKWRERTEMLHPGTDHRAQTAMPTQPQETTEIQLAYLDSGREEELRTGMSSQGTVSLNLCIATHQMLSSLAKYLGQMLVWLFGIHVFMFRPDFCYFFRRLKNNRRRRGSSEDISKHSVSIQHASCRLSLVFNQP